MPARVAHAVTHNDLTEHVGYIKHMVDRSIREGGGRKLALQIVNDVYDVEVDPRTGKEVRVVRAWGKTFLAPPGDVCRPKLDECEIDKIWDFMVLNCRYVFDPADIDTFATLKETLLSGGGDCFPEGTLLLTDRGQLLPIEKVQPGMRIWGRDRWSEITRKWFKGTLPVTAIQLNNGGWLHLTEDHKVYVGVCHRHNNRAETTSPCSCALDEREIVRVPVSELRPTMVLVQPESIATRTFESTPDSLAMAELVGYFLADGWVEESRVCISGKDGHPKEAQKRRVLELAKQLGISTSWHERYIRLNSPELATDFAAFGLHAPNKALLDLNELNGETAQALIRGLRADSGLNTHGPGYTYSTTSRKLAIQARVLHRMLGVSCGLIRVDNHGGLGTNPIYRLTPRLSDKGQGKLLRIKAIERELVHLPCFDISTDDHYVYLPEHDVTVSNCDDAAIAFATLLGSIGFRVLGRVISTSKDPNAWVHIYPLVGVPKEDPKQWIPLDITVEGSTPGWEYEDIGQYVDYVLV